MCYWITSKFVDESWAPKAILKVIRLIPLCLESCFSFIFSCSPYHPEIKYLMKFRPVDIYSQNYCSNYFNITRESLKFMLFPQGEKIKNQMQLFHIEDKVLFWISKEEILNKKEDNTKRSHIQQNPKAIIWLNAKLFLNENLFFIWSLTPIWKEICIFSTCLKKNWTGRGELIHTLKAWSYFNLIHKRQSNLFTGKNSS